MSFAYLAIISLHVIWGVNFLVAKLSLQQFPVMTLAFLRFFLAFLFLLPFLLVFRNNIKIAFKGLPWLILTGILMTTLNIGFVYAGLKRTDISVASTLSMSVPIFSVFFGWTILNEKISRLNILGIILGLAGAVMVIGLPAIFLGVKQVSTQNLIGNMLIILSCLCWVIGSTISRKKLAAYPALTLTAFLFLIGSATFFPLAVNEYLQNPSWIFGINLWGILGVAYIAIVSSVIAYFLFEYGLKRLGVIKANLFQYLEPLIAGFLGLLILKETPDLTFIIGGFLILLSAYLSTRPQRYHVIR